MKTAIGLKTPWTFFIVCPLHFNIIGSGFGVIYHSVYVIIGHYFEKHRALATGLAACGSGFGVFAMSPICTMLINSYGWRGALWLIAGITLHIAVYGSLFRPFETKDKDSQQKQSYDLNLLDWTLFKIRSFIIFTLAQFLIVIGKYTDMFSDQRIFLFDLNFLPKLPGCLIPERKKSHWGFKPWSPI